MGKKKPRPAQACIGVFAHRRSFLSLARRRNALPCLHGSEYASRETSANAEKPLKPARVALNVLALCFALSVLGRGLGESFTVFLKPISESFGWDRAAGGLGLFADLAGGRTDGAAGRPAVRPLRARALVYSLGLLLLGGAFLVASHAQALWQFQLSIGLCVGIGIALDRQRAEFDPARPLVRPAAADRDGDRLFRDRRRRAGAAAGVAGADRPYRLARRLPDVRHRRAVPAGAAAAAAVAAVRHRLAASSRRRPTPSFVDDGWTLGERDAPPRLLGAVLDLLLHRGRRCTRSRRRSSPI